MRMRSTVPFLRQLMLASRWKGQNKKRGGKDLLLTQPVTKWVTPSKKKNFETMKVLTSMTKLAATTDSRAIMFITRITLRTM